MLKLNESQLLRLIAKVKNSDNVVDVTDNIKGLEDYINTEMFKQLNKDYNKSEKKILTEFKKIIKREIKKEENYKEISKGTFVDNNMTNYLNGYWLISLNDDNIDLDLPQSKESINVNQLYYDDEDLFKVGLDNQLIEIEHKKYKKGMVGLRGNARDKYKRENGRISLTGFDKNNKKETIKLNIEYLYMFSKIFNMEECEIEFKDKNSPLQIVDNNGNKGIILPFRQND